MSQIFNCLPPQVVFQEVPDHVSLAFIITGCPLACPGCHSQHTWCPKSGDALDNQRFIDLLEQYRQDIDCVLFFGGEWAPTPLLEKLRIASQMKLATCLYTGMDRVQQRLRKHLTFLKTGAYLPERGGLTSPKTNQKFIDLRSEQLLNFKFLETATC